MGPGKVAVTDSQGPVRRDRAQWQALLAEQASSGLTQTVFCAQHAIPVSTFGYWKRKLAREGDGRDISLGSFIELSSHGDGTDEDWEIELELGKGMVLRLRRR